VTLKLRTLAALGRVAAALLPPLAASGAETPAAPLPRLISNNDMSNWTIFSPVPKPEFDASPTEVVEALTRSLRFTASPGVDAESFSPLYSTFPFWRSRLYTLSDHDRFLRSLRYYSDGKESGFPGPKRSAVRRALDEGVDFVRVFEDAPLETASGRPVDKIISFRVDVAHYTHLYDVFKQETRAQVLDEAAARRSPICNSGSVSGAEETEIWAQTAFTGYFEGFATGSLPAWLDNRCVAGRCLSAREVAHDCGSEACLVRTEGSKCSEVTLAFSSPAVRRFKLMQIEDLIEEEHPKAIELDFDRFPQLFSPATPLPQRRQIITDWLREVRKATAGVRLGLRTPSRIAHRAETGINLGDIARLGLADYAILAMPYFWDQQPQTDIDPAHSPLALYFEVTHETGVAPPDKDLLKTLGLSQDERYIERLSTARQLITGAHLAYSRGFHGIAMFNMQYYLRPSAGAPAVEYPTEAVLCMSKPDCAAASDQEYVLPAAHYHLAKESDMLPAVVGRARPYQFTLQLAPPAKGWAGAALVSLGFTALAAGGESKAYDEAKAALQVRLNGQAMTAQAQPSWPSDPRDGPKLNAHYEHYWLNAEPFRKVFAIDAKALVDGRNTITIDWDGADASVRAKVLDFRLFAPAAR
jgi:hypothetical protein